MGKPKRPAWPGSFRLAKGPVFEAAVFFNLVIYDDFVKSVAFWVLLLLKNLIPTFLVLTLLKE